MGVLLLCLLLPLGMVSCLHDPIPPMLQDGDSIVVVTDSAYEDLLDVASDYAKLPILLMWMKIMSWLCNI